MEDGEQLVRLLHGMGVPFQINAGLMSPREETGRDLQDADLDTYICLMKLTRELRGGEDCVGCDEGELPEPGGKATEAARGVRCGAGRSGFSIAWNGLMRPCNTFPEVAADALDLGFAEAWRRINAEVREFPQPLECEGCSYRMQCLNCVSDHASGAPVGHANPARCAWTRRMIAEGLIRRQEA